MAQNSAGLYVGCQEKGSGRERPVYEQEGGKRPGLRTWKGRERRCMPLAVLEPQVLGLSRQRMRPMARRPLASSWHCHWGSEPSTCGNKCQVQSKGEIHKI